MAYDLKDVKLPILSGAPLTLTTKLIEFTATGNLIAPKLIKDAGILLLREIELDEVPTTFPRHPSSPNADAKAVDLSKLPESQQPEGGFQFNTSADFYKAYQNGDTTPTEVARRVLAAIEKSNQAKPALRAVIQINHQDVVMQAEASTERWKAGKPLSLLDGVPVSVKAELDQIGHGTTVGTSFLGKTPATQDATPVARLRAAGALLIGKANMHEIGMGVTGLNLHHGVPRNPYHTGSYTGGSSSGSAASVAAGFCPISVGADGGGSIRIPASFCGGVGLKATYGRVSEHGAAPLCWSVAHVGPIAATVYDTALAYAIMAGPDELDPMTQSQPEVDLEEINNGDLTGIRIGMYRAWFEHADRESVEACDRAVELLKSRGASVVQIEILNLEAIRVAHSVTIASEMRSAITPYYPSQKEKFGLDVRMNMALAQKFTSADYVTAQRVRTRALNDFKKIFESVDVVVSPTTGCTAPNIPAAALENGISDVGQLMDIMRFAPLGNLLGLPGISVPAGYDSRDKPIGLQIMGRPWEESTLLRLARVVESETVRQKPSYWVDVLRG
ncbi:MAG: amidase [Deltaproteobacteria bacterium]|jgi:Asp-tRNA(Asn)/Glu-tRNA(Gln) amidotransferase A subunit family amidase|nr:amidase [Deltaproteobacteria bacterium]MBT6434415.1 amidase [Deltaproteobacteria bacterium]MBT6488115.1 amidase [Deltaproteobacteria bacterium]